MQDMNQDEQEEAKTVSRRVEKLGKAFQNYRRAIIKILKDRIFLKKWFQFWLRYEDETKDPNGGYSGKSYLAPKQRCSTPTNVSLADIVWTEQDMDEFLRTVASFDTHKRLWKQKREDRKNPKH